MDVEEYQRLTSKINRLQREADRQVGAQEQLKRELEEKFGTKSIKQAKALLAKMREEEKLLEAEYDREFEQFIDKWNKLL